MPRDRFDEGLTDEEKRIAYRRRLYAKLAAAALFTVLFALIFDAWSFVFLLLLIAIPITGIAFGLKAVMAAASRINDAITPIGTAPKRDTHGSAAWASQEDVTAYDLQPFGLDPDRLILGHFGNTGSFKTLQLRTDGHLVTVARSRAGKGVSVVLPNLLNYGGGVVCTDPKGENAAITADYRRRVLKQNVYVLDPWGVSKLSDRARFNPLLTLDPASSTLTRDCDRLAGLCVQGRGDVDSHWNESAADVIAGVLMHIATSEPAERCNFVRLRSLLSLPPDAFEEQVTAAMLRSTAAGGRVAEAGGRIMTRPPNERGSILSTAHRHTKWTDAEEIRHVIRCEENGFSLDDLWHGNTSLYLCLPGPELKTSSPWLRVMVGLSLYAIIDKGLRPDRQVLFMLDEFAYLGHLPPVEMAAGLGAGFGCQLWPIFQDMSQVEQLYPGLWRSFFANAAAIQAFGVNDPRAAEELSKRLGPQTVKTRSRSESETGDRSTMGQSEGETGRPLLMPDEIMRLPSHRKLVLLQGHKPILAEKIDYRREEPFMSRARPNPMYARSP